MPNPPIPDCEVSLVADCEVVVVATVECARLWCLPVSGTRCGVRLETGGRIEFAGHGCRDVVLGALGTLLECGSELDRFAKG